MSRSSGPNASLSDGIQALSKSNAKLERMLAKIGTKADTAEFRDRMHQEQTASTAQVKQVMELLKQAARASTDSDVVRRLTTQFDREFKKFQQLNRTMDEKQVRVIDAVKQNNRRASNAHGLGQGRNAAQYDEEDPLTTSAQRGYDDSSMGMPQQQTAQELDIQFIEYDVAELERRQVEILQIERDVQEVGELYKDLHLIVHEQQEHIDTIDASIVQAKERTEAGHQELLGAEEYQKKARKKQCCLLFLVLAIVGVIVGVVYLAK